MQWMRIRIAVAKSIEKQIVSMLTQQIHRTTGVFEDRFKYENRVGNKLPSWLKLREERAFGFAQRWRVCG
jgi:hypothetical protein